jgi:hypothetical protein
MKTQHYNFLALFAFLIFSSTAFGQKLYVTPYAAYPVYPSYPGHRCHHMHQPYTVIVAPPGPRVIIPAPMPIPSPGPKIIVPAPVPVPVPAPTPKIGLQLNVLPNGYYGFSIGPTPYYYYNGTYYQPYGTGYMVIPPPMGAIVYQLPRGAALTQIDGENYYEYNGTYYKQGVDSENKFSYTVVSADGVVNQDADVNQASTKVAYKTDELPDHCRPVVVDGERLYATASGQYYKKVFEGDKVYYELVER